MWPPENDKYRGVIVSGERTPSMNEEPPAAPELVADAFVPGIYRHCYICGIETARLQKESVWSLCYTKSQSNKEIRHGMKPERYVLTFCVNCYVDVKK